MNPAIGKAPDHETLREASGLIDKIEWREEEQRPSLPIPKILSQGKPNQQTPRRHFTQLKVPLTQVIRKLRETNVLACEVPKERYKLKKYDPNVRCEYHMGQAGHSTKDCWRLKNRVQDMIDAKIIKPDFLDGLINNSNSIPSLIQTSSGPTSSSSIDGLFLPADKLA